MISHLKGVTLLSVERCRGYLAVFILAAFFAVGILCATFAAPGRALASVSPCSQMPGGMAMSGCEHPNYLCGFDPTTSPFSYGALSSVRSNDLLKNLPAFALGVPVTDSFIEIAPPGAREWKNISVPEPGKVSLRLFNSILNL